MTPLELLALIAVFAVVRIAITVRPRPPAVVGVDRGEDDSAAVEQPRGGPSMRTVVREYLDAFIVAGLVALFLITFVVRTFFIPSGSMEPTLQIHDVLLANEFEYRFAIRTKATSSCSRLRCRRRTTTSSARSGSPATSFACTRASSTATALR